jgi:hypothetical protein
MGWRDVLSDPNGSAAKVRAWAFSPNGDALFKTVVTVLLAILGYFGARTLNILDEVSKSVRALEIVNAGQIEKIEEVRSRNSKQDADIDDLRRRLYRIPEQRHP